MGPLNGDRTRHLFWFLTRTIFRYRPTLRHATMRFFLKLSELTLFFLKSVVSGLYCSIALIQVRSLLRSFAGAHAPPPTVACFVHILFTGDHSKQDRILIEKTGIMYSFFLLCVYRRSYLLWSPVILIIVPFRISRCSSPSPPAR